jgi:hypothetical protein
MAGISFAKTVADCELLMRALEPLLAGMPHLSGEHAELGEFLDEVKILNLRQSDLTGALRQVTRLRRAAELRGQDLRSRVAAQIRGKLGFTNQELLKFGIAPRRKALRRRSEDPSGTTTPATPTVPAATPTPKTE